MITNHKKLWLISVFFRCLIILAVFRGVVKDLRATPYQLIETDSATLIKKDSWEVKADYSREEGPIPAELIKTQYREGLLSWMEIAFSATYAKFIEQEEERLSEVNIKIKFHLFDLLEHHFYSYLKYRRALGDAVIVDVDDEELENVVQVVSQHADKGEDSSLGLLTRGSFGRGKYNYHLGLEYTKAGGRDYGDFTEEEEIVTGLFAFQMLLFRKKLMLALENKYVRWIGRGDYYELIPQARWEFVPDWTMETGVSFQAIGGGVYRYIIGITYEYD